MKKYLTFAAILGAAAFLSVSFLAQAADKAPSAEEEKPASEKAFVASPDLAYARDRAACDIATTPATEDASQDPATKADALKKCLLSKGHTDEEVTKEESSRNPVPTTEGSATPSTTAPAPATGAPSTAPVPAEKK
jgi:hypothetical protein